jgi:hypothetical protein
VRHNVDRDGYGLAQRVLGGRLSWLTEEVVGERPLAAAAAGAAGARRDAAVASDS